MPFLFKYAIDALTADPAGHMLADMPMVQLLPATVLLGYGAARAGSSLCNELRNAVFAKVAAPAIPISTQQDLKSQEFSIVLSRGSTIPRASPQKAFQQFDSKSPEHGDIWHALHLCKHACQQAHSSGTCGNHIACCPAAGPEAARLLSLP